MSAPRPKRPVLSMCPDPIQDRLDEMALARAGQSELDHPLNMSQRTDLLHAVIACGRCGGVYGGDGIFEGKGHCPTKRCTCKRRGGR